jgi:hypothetical protein
LAFGLFAFWVKGGFLIWEALEGERTIEEKGLLKGENKLLKGKCWRETAEGKGITKEKLIESLH